MNNLVLTVLLLFLHLQLSVTQQYNLCAIEKCECDVPSQTASCNGVIFQYLPLLPEWLRILVIDKCQLVALGKKAFKGAADLKTLVISRTPLEYIDPDAFDGLRTLQTLDLSHNQLVHFSRHILTQLPSLVSVDLSDNHIADLSQFDNVVRSDRVFENINLAGNPIKFAPEKTNLPLVKSLNLARNSWLRKVNGSGFLFRPSAGCPSEESCRFLHISIEQWNLFRWLDISDCATEIDKTALDRLKNLTSLNIAGSNLDQAETLNVFQEYHQLRYLNASNIHVHHLNRWTFFPKMLNTLDISGIGIRDIQLKYLSGRNDLKVLDISRNKIRSLTLSVSLSGLEMLFATHNRLDTFPKMPAGEKLAALKSMDLSYNDIDVLGAFALSSYPKIQFLNLSNNRISTISNTAFPTVGQMMGSLDLSFNLLSDMPALVIPTLHTLHVDSNRLRTIDPMLFQGLPMLDYLDLSQNPHLFVVKRGGDCDGQLRPPPPFIHHPLSLSFDDNYHCYPEWLPVIATLRRLRTINLGRTGLVRIPDGFLASLDSLKKIDLSGNAFTADSLATWSEHRALPPCLVSLDLSFNRLVSLGNTSDYFLKMRCLQHLDLSHNPFMCNCHMAEMKRLYEERQLVTNVQNDSLYYCFAPKNHWQYPLYTFLTAVEPCEDEYDFGISLLKTIGILFLFTCAFVCCYLSSYKIVSAFCDKQWRWRIHYFYKPLRADATDAELSSPCTL